MLARGRSRSGPMSASGTAASRRSATSPRRRRTKSWTAAAAREGLHPPARAVAPGFVDSHTHSDLAPFLGDEHDELRAATIRQGITTEICGNCGFSPFPYVPPRQEEVARLIGALFGPREPWSDFAGYRD